MCTRGRACSCSLSLHIYVRVSCVRACVQIQPSRQYNAIAARVRTSAVGVFRSGICMRAAHMSKKNPPNSSPAYDACFVRGAGAVFGSSRRRRSMHGARATHLAGLRAAFVFCVCIQHPMCALCFVLMRLQHHRQHSPDQNNTHGMSQQICVRFGDQIYDRPCAAARSGILHQCK